MFDGRLGSHSGREKTRDRIYSVVKKLSCEMAVDAGASAGIDCLSLPSRASADAPEEKEADELEPASPASL